MVGLSHIPTELLPIITAHLTDPCDLLALRLTSTLFNTLLSERFSVTFPRHLYMRNNQSSPKLALGALRQAAINAVRHGNEKMMVAIIAFILDTYGDEPHQDILGECFEIALGEDQIEIGKRLIDDGVKPSWANLRSDWVLVELAIDAHHIDLVEYMIRHGVEGARGWNRNDVDVIEQLLEMYFGKRTKYTDTWYQRTLHMLLAREVMSDRLMHWDEFVAFMELLKRRNYGSECDVWFGENRRVGEEEMLLELRKLERGEYA